MFNATVKKPSLPQIETHRRPKLHETDIFNPSGAHPATGNVQYAHRGREPGTSYAAKSLEYRLYKKSLVGVNFEAEDFDRRKQISFIKFSTPAEKKRHQLHIQKRLNCKLEQMAKEIDWRRHRLRELIAEEDNIFITETIDKAQEGDTMKFDRIRNDVKDLMEQREIERQNYIQEKRIIQYANRCAELRPIIAKKRLFETKTAQLQQMRENEARREAERELDKLWQDVRKKQDEAMLDREKQDTLFRYNNTMKGKEVLRLQIEGKKLQKLEQMQLEKANYIEMTKDNECKLQAETFAALKLKQKKEEDAKSITQQIMEQQKFASRRKMEETAIDDAFSRLCQLEIDREKSKISDTKMNARHEVATYKEHLLDLENQRKREEIERNNHLLEYQRKVQQEQETRTCAEKEKKRKMTQECIKALGEQIHTKKLEAEENLKSRKLENELIQQCLQTNVRLEKESDRLHILAIEQYRHDLRKQIEYNKLLKERERIDLERQLKVGMEEEEKYQKLVLELISAENEGHQHGVGKHPFRKMLEQYDCHSSKQ